MRVLITGGSGQVGTHLIEEAKARGWTPIAPGRADLDLGKLTAPDDLDLTGIDGVLNAGAYTAVDAAEDDEATAEALNARAPGVLAEACAKAGIPLVHYSTDYVFDGASEVPYTEDDKVAPLGAYGRTKLAGEAAVAASGANAATLRLAWVFSAHGKNFVKTMLRLGKEHGAVRVVDDQYGRPTPAKAAAIAGLDVLDALKADPAKAGLYHFSGDETVSWAGFARAIFEAAGLEVPVTPITTADFPTPAARPKYSVMDSGKIHAVFGIDAADWRDALAEIIPALMTGETKA